MTDLGTPITLRTGRTFRSHSELWRALRLRDYRGFLDKRMRDGLCAEDAVEGLFRHMEVAGQSLSDAAIKLARDYLAWRPASQE